MKIYLFLFPKLINKEKKHSTVNGKNKENIYNFFLLFAEYF